MAKDRLRITLEFSQSKPEELKLYQILLRYSNPSSYIKDCMKGILEIPIEYRRCKK